MLSAALSRFIALVLMAAGLGTAYWVYDEAVRPIWQNEPSSEWAVLDDGSLAAGAPAQNEDSATNAVLQTPALSEAELRLEVTDSPALEESTLSPDTAPENWGAPAEKPFTGEARSESATGESPAATPTLDPASVPSAWPANPRGAEMAIPVRAPVQIGASLD